MLSVQCLFSLPPDRSHLGVLDCIIISLLTRDYILNTATLERGIKKYPIGRPFFYGFRPFSPVTLAPPAPRMMQAEN